MTYFHHLTDEELTRILYVTGASLSVDDECRRALKESTSQREALALDAMPVD